MPARASHDTDELIARMLRVGGCWSPSLSPGGQRLAFVSDVSGIPQAWTVDSRGGPPRSVTELDDPVTAVAWSPAGGWLAFVVAPGGGMNTQVHVAWPDGTGSRRLSDGGAERNWLAGWARDGRTLMVSSNRVRPDRVDAYLIDAASGDRRLVADGRPLAVLTDVSGDARHALLRRARHRGDDDLYLVDLAGGCETLLTPHEPPGHFAAGRFTPRGDLYLSSDGDRERVALARVRRARPGGPGPVELVAARDEAELDGFALSADGGTAVLPWNLDGRSQLEILDLGSGRTAPVPGLPAEVVSGVDVSRDGRRVALALSGAAAPADCWVLDRQAGTLTQVTRTPHPGADLGRLVRPGLLRFAAHDGIRLSGWLYRPPGRPGPGPAVLSFHGGPESQERPRFSALYQALLAAGIAVFAPNVRGSTGFGKTFGTLDDGARRFDAIRDIAACADAVVDAGVAAPERLGIMGASYGGYMTMAGLTVYPERFAAGASLHGIVNFATFFAHSEPWMAAISKAEYGDPLSEADLLAALSPVHRLDRVRAPTIVLHGTNDTNVPVCEAEQVVSGLRSRGVPVEYLLFPDEGHGFVRERNRMRACSAVVEWFRRHL
ncbi:MAG TPA: prolyl oligopeptidase family serine peptidase [Egibacteraceae bacterium]|nr:prolyl oligopeptidase family serine peptidase [Egibacteraceae bacterium]